MPSWGFIKSQQSRLMMPERIADKSDTFVEVVLAAVLWSRGGWLLLVDDLDIRSDLLEGLRVVDDGLPIIVQPGRGTGGEVQLGLVGEKLVTDARLRVLVAGERVEAGTLELANLLSAESRSNGQKLGAADRRERTRPAVQRCRTGLGEVEGEARRRSSLEVSTSTEETRLAAEGLNEAWRHRATIRQGDRKWHLVVAVTNRGCVSVQIIVRQFVECFEAWRA